MRSFRQELTSGRCVRVVLAPGEGLTREANLCHCYIHSNHFSFEKWSFYRFVLAATPKPCEWFGKKKKSGHFQESGVEKAILQPACFQLTWLHHRNEVNERNTFHMGKWHGNGLNIDEVEKWGEEAPQQPSPVEWGCCPEASAVWNSAVPHTLPAGFLGEGRLLSWGGGHHVPAPLCHRVLLKALGVPQWIKHLASLTQTSPSSCQQQSNYRSVCGRLCVSHPCLF